MFYFDVIERKEIKRNVDELILFVQGIAKFMEKTRNGRVKFDPKRVVMAGGATGANENLIRCLADPGNAFLVPTPYYPG